MVKKDIIFVADVYASGLQGGAELVNDQVIRILKEDGHDITQLLCSMITVNFLKAISDNAVVIFGSFITLSEAAKDELSTGKYDYIVYEHDHKYLRERDPSCFRFFKAPSAAIVNTTFYQKASLVVCQSLEHERIINLNLHLKNTHSVGSSLWDDGFLDALPSISTEKTKEAAIVASTNKIKNQQRAEAYCKENNIPYEVISAPTPLELCKKLAPFKYLVFFPGVPESLCRVVVEAKMVGCKIISNKLLGAASEEWFRGTPKEIIKEMKGAPTKTLNILRNAIEKSEIHTSQKSHFKVVVPFYNAEKWIGKCIASIKDQKYKNYQCYIIDDNSTDKSHEVISQLIEEDPRFILVKNKKNVGALENIYTAIQKCDPDAEDIIVTLDGDDWFSSPLVLDLLNYTYEKQKCWMTYGSYLEYPTGNKGKFSQQIPWEVIEENKFRQSPWFSSHLRTFKYKLWQDIRKEDLLETEGQFYSMAWDLAFMLPMLEMSGHRSHFISDPLYIYNNDNPLNDHKKDNSKQRQLEANIRHKDRYERQEEPNHVCEPPPPALESLMQSSYKKWVKDSGEAKRYDYPLTPDSIVMDVGGYIGDFAHNIHTAYGCYLYIYEPVERFVSILKNRFKDSPKIEICPHALGAETKETTINISSDATSLHNESLNNTQTESISIKNIVDVVGEISKTDIDLLKINIEGSEYGLLEKCVTANILPRFKNIQIQFHTFVDGAYSRRNSIRKALEKTHTPTYDYPFIWENWTRNDIM